MQTKLQIFAPLPVSVVWIEQQGDTETSIRNTFQTIRSLGFTALKQLVLQSTVSVPDAVFRNKTQQIMNMALDEGLIPWFYDIGGYECITLDLLSSLNISSSLTPDEILQYPAMQNYQLQVMRNRIANMTFTPYTLGEPGAGNPYISTATQLTSFAEWLNITYQQNITLLQQVWNDWYRSNLTTNECTNFTDCAMLLYQPSGTSPTHDYRRYRDSMRWQSDVLNNAFVTQILQGYAHDPSEPQRTGGAMMFLNQAYFGWDMFQHGAYASQIGASFYISSHLQWHYSELQHEIDRAVFFSVKLTVDAARSNHTDPSLYWPAEWESSGGPGQYSGGFSTSITGTMLRKLMLTYIGAGMRGIGLWTYNGRQKGQEAAEYMLVNIQGQPSSRAIVAGEIAQSLGKYRRELWSSYDNPVVAILYSWENEANHGRIYMQTPPWECTFDDLDCKLFNAREMNNPTLSRMGWARALIDTHIPWTHVDESQIRNNILTILSMTSLRVLIIPHAMTLSLDILPILRDWQINQGGRIIADMPYLLMENNGIVVDQLNDEVGSISSAIFGCYVQEFHSVETPFDSQLSKLSIPAIENEEMPLPKRKEKGIHDEDASDGLSLYISRGQWSELGITTGTITMNYDTPFDDRIAIIENTKNTGNGSAVFLNFEAGRIHARPHGLNIGDNISPSAPYITDVYTTLQISAWLSSIITQNGNILNPSQTWSAIPLGIPVYLRTVPATNSSSTIHHWFIIHDDIVAADVAARGAGKNMTVTITMPWVTTSVINVLTGEVISYCNNGNTSFMNINVPFRDAVWLRSTE